MRSAPHREDAFHVRPGELTIDDLEIGWPHALGQQTDPVAEQHKYLDRSPALTWAHVLDAATSSSYDGDWAKILRDVSDGDAEAVSPPVAPLEHVSDLDRRRWCDIVVRGPSCVTVADFAQAYNGGGLLSSFLGVDMWLRDCLASPSNDTSYHAKYAKFWCIFMAKRLGSESVREVVSAIRLLESTLSRQPDSCARTPCEIITARHRTHRAQLEFALAQVLISVDSAHQQYNPAGFTDIRCAVHSSLTRCDPEPDVDVNSDGDGGVDEDEYGKIDWDTIAEIQCADIF